MSSEIFITFFSLLNLILGVVRRGVRRGSPWTGPEVVHGPGPYWGSLDRGSVFSGYPLTIVKAVVVEVVVVVVVVVVVNLYLNSVKKSSVILKVF